MSSGGSFYITEAFSDLKKSEFFKDVLPAANTKELTKNKSPSKLNPLLINPKQVSFLVSTS